MVGAFPENDTKLRSPPAPAVIKKVTPERKKVNIAGKNQVRYFDEEGQWSVRSSEQEDDKHLFNPHVPGPIGPCQRSFNRASKQARTSVKNKILKIDEFTTIEKPKKIPTMIR